MRSGLSNFFIESGGKKSLWHPLSDFLYDFYVWRAPSACSVSFLLIPEKGSKDYFYVVALDGGRKKDVIIFSFPLFPEGLNVEKSLSLLMNELCMLFFPK